MSKYPNNNQQSAPYSTQQTPPPIEETYQPVQPQPVTDGGKYPPDQPSNRRWWLFGLPILPFLLIWFAFPRTIIEQVPFEVVTVVTQETMSEVEVTRIVREEVPVEVPFEVTRIISEEVVVTKEVPVEVTRVVEEVVEVEVTRVVTEYQPVEVTRVVEKYIPQTEPPVGGACARFNLEVGRDRERGTHGSGIYEMREASGLLLATWQAVDGSTDSGWVQTAALSAETVHVYVTFTPTGSSQSVLLEVVNPAPDTTYGWLQRGICHAIELQFPEGA